MISALPNASLGCVIHLHRYDATAFTPTAAVLCRNTAPLVSFALSALARGVACHIVGKEISVGLEKLLSRTATLNLPSPALRLKLHSNKLVDMRKAKSNVKAAAVEDKYNALLAITDGAKDSNDVLAKLRRIFADGNGLTLSTIHRAKGLEWPTVFLLDWHLLPSPYAVGIAALRQEKNLQYVAVTRAKLDLIFIRSDSWK